MANYIIAAAFSGLMLLLASIISISIKFQAGVNPKDILYRRIWFWAIAVGTPFLFFLIATLGLAPDPNVDYMAFTQHQKTIPYAMAISFVIYVFLGFILSRIFRTGKLGGWF